ncbi:MAG: hypothetical protein QM756_27120 [Polyangiaceae bacterium]
MKRWVGLSVGFALGACAPNAGHVTVAPLPSVRSTAPALPSADIVTAPPRASQFASFSPSGKLVVSRSSDDEVVVAELPSLRVVARLRSPQLSGPNGAELSLPSDAQLAIKYWIDENPHEELRNLANGAVVSDAALSVSEAPIATPFGPAHLEVVNDEDGTLKRARLSIERTDHGKRQMDLRASFGERYLHIESLGVFGESLLLRSEGWDGVPVGRVGSVNLRTGRIRLVPERLSGVGQVAIAGQRMALLQSQESAAWLFELPSLTRVATFTYADAQVIDPTQMPGGEGQACIALSPDFTKFAMTHSLAPVRWYDTATGALLGEQEELSVAGGYFSCELAFTPDGTHLVRSTRFGSVNVIKLASGDVTASYSYAYCYNCNGASGNVEWKSGSVLSADRRFFAVANTADESTKSEPRFGFLIDLVENRVHELGEASQATFDPTSRYLAVDDRVYATSPFRLLGPLQ